MFNEVTVARTTQPVIIEDQVEEGKSRSRGRRKKGNVLDTCLAPSAGPTAIVYIGSAFDGSRSLFDARCKARVWSRRGRVWR